MFVRASRAFPVFLFSLLLLPVSPFLLRTGGDPWKDLAGGGEKAEAVLSRLQAGGPEAMLAFLQAGLSSGDRKVRYYCAQNLPPAILGEKDLKKVFEILLREWKREDLEPPLPEGIQEKLDDLVSSFLEGRETPRLEDVAGWGDEERILGILAGLERGKAPWGRPGKAGRRARRELADLLFPCSDAAGQEKAAAVLADKKRDPRETAPARWISLAAGEGCGYPGDRVIRALLGAFLAASKAEGGGIRALPVRMAGIARSLPALAGHYRAIPLLRDFLARSGGRKETLLVWAALSHLTGKAPAGWDRTFWKEGVRPLEKILETWKDQPEVLFRNFLLLAPALAGDSKPGVPSEEAARALSPLLLPALERIASSGGLTNELFSVLLRIGDADLLAGTLRAAPARDLDTLLEEEGDLPWNLPPGKARSLAASKDPVLARLGKAALRARAGDPRAQPDRVLARLAPIPATDRPAILEEALKRGLVKDPSRLQGWWKAFLEEDSPEGARIARAYPGVFRSWLAAAAEDRNLFQEALAWCVSHGVDTPFRTALPPEVRKALEELPAGETDPAFPPVLARIGLWLTPGDRASVGPVLFGIWRSAPERLDTGSPEGDFRLLANYFRGRERDLAALLEKALESSPGQRTAEVCVGGLVRLGDPPGAKELKALFSGGKILPTEFMCLRACPILPVLPVLEEVLRDQGDDGWDLFFPLAWAARIGDGPAPLPPTPPEPRKEWWDLAARGRFTEIYADLLSGGEKEGEEFPLATALRGLALSARSGKEKSLALTLLAPYLEERTRGGYWDALPGAARLGDEKARKAFEEALAAGRRFFVQKHLLPWIRCTRDRRWLDFLYRKGLPASGIPGDPFQEALAALLPELDPRVFPGEKDEPWCRAAVERIAAAGGTRALEDVRWSPLLGGWKLP